MIIDLFTVHQDKFIALFILVFLSIFIRLFLQILGQKWISTISHTSTLVFLPILTFIITNVISGNIALSLGMVGALSIVRFRNPVRSPLELTVYFGAITMGIAASVSLRWLLFFALAIFFGIFILLLFQFFSRKIFNTSFFKTSFSEGNTSSFLELQSSTDISLIEDSSLLTLKSFENNNIRYVLNSNNYHELKKLLDQISNNEAILKYQITK